MSDNPYEKAYQREKSARNEAEHLLEDLSRKLYEKNEEVNQLYEDLKRNQSIMVQHEKLASVGELASGIAHEINNPVGFCLTNLNSLQDQLPLYYSKLVRRVLPTGTQRRGLKLNTSERIYQRWFGKPLTD